MIVLIGRYFIREDRIEQAKDMFLDNSRGVRKVPGLISRTVLQSERDPLRFSTITIFENDEARLAWSDHPDHIHDDFKDHPIIPPHSEYFKKYGQTGSCYTRLPDGDRFEVIADPSE